MTDRLLHITAEHEPLAYHKAVSPAGVFGVTLAPEYLVTNPESDAEETAASEYIDAALPLLRSASLYLYTVTEDAGTYKLKLVGEVEKQVLPDGAVPSVGKFNEWLDAKNTALAGEDLPPHRYGTPPLGTETPDGAQASVGQILRASQMLDAPVPHRLGLTRIAKLDGFEAGSNPTWHVFLIYADGEVPADELVASALLEDTVVERFQIDYEPFGGIGTVTVRTVPLRAAPTDLGLVDPDTGFLLAEAGDPDLWRALNRFEDRAAAQVWPLPRLLAAAEALVGADFQSQAEGPKWRRWLAVAGSVSALDPILHALAPQEAAGQAASELTTEGHVLAAIVGPAADLYRQVVGNDAGPRLPMRLAAMERLAGATLRALIDQRLVDVRPGGASDPRGVIAALGEADGLAPLSQALEGVAEGTPPVGYAASQAEIVQALGTLMSLLQEETGVEAAIKALLEPLFVRDSTNPLGVYGEALANAIDAGMADEEKKVIADVAVQLWQRAGATFETRFNGAEAVRRSTGEAWLKALTDDARALDVNGRLTLTGCRDTLLNTSADPLKRPPLLYAYRFGIVDGTGDIRALAKMATRFWRPANHLPSQAVLDLLVTQTDTQSNDLNAQQMAQAEALFGTEAPEPRDLRLMLPDQTPAPLPLRIADDMSGEDLVEFQRVFHGFGVLVQRQTGADPEPWQNASVVELQSFDKTNEDGGPEYVALTELALRPANPMPVDGRMALFLDYHGLPLSGAAFDSAVSAGAALPPRVRMAFGGFTSVADADGSNDVRVPGLAYGSIMRAAAFGVTKAGSLPAGLQDGKPWRPGKPMADPDHLLALPYRRRTAIGRVALDTRKVQDLSDTDLDMPAGLKRALTGVQALSDDYPRLAMAAFGVDEGQLDLFRNSDGRGALLGVTRGPRVLTLKDLQGWGGTAKLSLTLRTLKWQDGIVSDDALHDPITVDVAAAGPFVDLEIIIEAGGNVAVTFDGQTKSVMADTAKLARPHWLRLSLKANEAGQDVATSLSDPNGDDAAPAGNGKAGEVAADALEFYARPEAVAATLVAPKPGEEAPRDWRPGVPANYVQKISFPRVTFADFDRWTENTDLRADLWGLGDDEVIGLTVAEVLAAYVYRHTPRDPKRPEDAPLKDYVDRLPDPAVSHLVIDLIPQDTLTGQALAPIRNLVPAGLTLEKTDIPAKNREKLQNYEDFLKKIDAGFTFEMTVTASAAKDAELKLLVNNETRKIEVVLPKGVAARVLVRPAVPARYFAAGDSGVSAFDPGLEPHRRGSFMLDGDKHLIFAGAEAVYEAMLADLKDHETELRGDIVHDAVICDPGGPERAYALRILEPGTEERRRIWRRLAGLDILTQRWRFSGRPIYNWASPAALAMERNPVVPLTGDFVQTNAYGHFEEEAFFDRADSDADRVAVRLEPIMMRDPDLDKAGQEVLRVDWAAPTATLFRHRFEMKSRYARAMLGRATPFVTSWETPDNTTLNGQAETSGIKRLDAWTMRVAMLADRARIALNRPQIRALVPLTQAPDQGDDLVSPPVLAVLEDRPLAQGGLAERMVGEIVTGLHFGFKGADSPVEPLDLRKEFGPDPRMELLATEVDLAQRLTLEQEGPVGLTFDSRNIAAPAFANCQHMFRPVTLNANGDGTGYWQEQAMGLSLRRMLDPGWVMHEAALNPGQIQPLNSGWIYDFEDLGDLVAHGVKVLTIVRNDAEQRKVQILNTAIYPTGQDELPKTLCVLPEGRISILHQPLADGSYKTSVLYWPEARDPEARLLKGLDNAPRLLGAMDWSIPPETKIKSEHRGLRANGAATVVPASASLATETEWIMQTRDAAAMHLAQADGTPDELPVAAATMRARLTELDGGLAVEFFQHDDPKQAWVQPRLGEHRLPKTLHRHLALIGTTWSTGLGRRYEVYHSTALALSRNVPLDRTPNMLPERVRLVEFETPAQPVCLNHDKSVARRYQGAYFDLVATGGETAAAYRFLLRPTRDPDALVTDLKFTVAIGDDETKDKTISLALSEATPEDRAVFVEMTWKMNGTDVEVTARKILANGTVVPVMARLILKDNTTAESKFELPRAPGIRFRNIKAAGVNGHLWADMSVLHRASDKSDFDFDWIFGARQRDETAAFGTRPDALAALNEAQARIVAVTPALELHRNG